MYYVVENYDEFPTFALLILQITSLRIANYAKKLGSTAQNDHN